MAAKKWVRFLTIAMAGAALAACALRLGGARSVTYEMIGLGVDPAPPPAELGEWIRSARPDVVLLAAPADTLWFGQVAEAAGLRLSGPGIQDGAGLAFLAGDPLGDSTVVLDVNRGGRLLVQDALYRVDGSRYLNLLAFGVDAPERVRETVRALLEYVATDVMHNASVVIAARVPDAAVGDSLASLLSPAFRDGIECMPAESRPAAPPPLRLFFGPELRLRCEHARVLERADLPFQARFVVP